jgi:hypothetical protein
VKSSSENVVPLPKLVDIAVDSSLMGVMKLARLLPVKSSDSTSPATGPLLVVRVAVMVAALTAADAMTRVRKQIADAKAAKWFLFVIFPSDDMGSVRTQECELGSFVTDQKEDLRS